MKGWARPTGWGVLLVAVGLGLFVVAIAQNLVSDAAAFDVLQSGYVGAAAVGVAAIGGWTVRAEWSPEAQRSVLGWTLLGGGFLLVLALLALLDLESTNAIERMDADFFVLHFTTFGCLGGSVVGVYYARARRSARRATAERERFETVVQRTPLPTMVTDMDGVVDVWNDAAEATFGYDADDVKGRPAPLVPPEKRGEAAECLDRLASGETVEGLRTKRRRSDGTLLDVELWATPVPDPRTDETYAVVVFRDLTHLELLEQRRAVLERVLRHNLRNELTVVRGYAERLANDDREDVAREAETIRSAADRLVSLSEHVAHLQRLDERVTSRDVGACTEAVVTRLRREYPDATITVEAPSETWVQAVPLLFDAVAEAVENAIVHADDADPTVEVCVTADGEEYVRVSIADRGPGIPDAEWRPIQNRTEEPLEHESGLGLWVMHWAATRSGGRLSKTDRDPTGTVVTFTLPKTLGAPERSPPNATPST
ncbi:MAG: PAS domain S-box protein [Haloplanus sp.]